jgi:hypothetical protein
MENDQRHVVSKELTCGRLLLRRREIATASALGMALCVLVGCKNDKHPMQIAEPPSQTQSPPPNQRPLLSRDEQTKECRDHIVKFSKGIFSSVRFFDVDDMRNGAAQIEFLRFHACATEAGATIPRYYVFGCNFSFNGEKYTGAPLSMVLHGPHEWPFKDSVLGPVFNMTTEQQRKEDAGREERQLFLNRHPPTNPEYGTDPCNGGRVLIGR